MIVDLKCGFGLGSKFDVGFLCTDFVFNFFFFLFFFSVLFFFIFVAHTQIYFGPSIPTIFLDMIKAPELTQLVQETQTKK
jgi:hypothetical protein